MPPFSDDIVLLSTYSNDIALSEWVIPEDGIATPEDTEQAALKKKLALSAKMEHPVVPVGFEKDISILLSLVAPSVEKDRAPCNLSLVLDKSGSMKGDKLNLVICVAKFVVQQLDSRDQLGIVLYDSKVQELVPMGPLTAAEKTNILQKLDRVVAGDSTNLSGGLLKGLQQFLGSANKTQAKDAAKSVFLFTDGLANQGVTTTQGIISATQGALKSVTGGVSVHCFGFGSDHDHDMLSQVSEACGGDYMYIESESSIANAFAQALGGLLSSVAQNIELSIESVNHKDFPIIVVGAPDFPSVRDTGSGTINIELGDMYADSQKDILLVGRPGNMFSEKKDTVLLGVARVRYFNLLTSDYDSLLQPLSITVGDALSAMDTDVDFHRNRLETVEAMKEAQRLAQEGHLEEARCCLNAHSLKVEQTMSGYEERTVQLQMNCADAAKDMENAIQYRSVGSKKLSWHAARNSKQRALGEDAATMGQYSTKGQMDATIKMQHFVQSSGVPMLPNPPGISPPPGLPPGNVFDFRI